MNINKYVLVALVLGSFAAGRYTLPAKVITTTQTVAVDNKTSAEQDDVNQSKHVVTKTKTTEKPDGSKVTTTVTTSDTNTDKDKKVASTDDSTITKATTKEVVNNTSTVNLSLMTGTKFSFGANPLVYGGSVTKQVLGPVTIGVWGLSSGEGGASVGLTF